VKRFFLGCQLAVAATLVLATPAAAEQSQPAQPAGPIAFLILEGSEGYDVFIATIGNRVILETQHKRVAAAYLVRGRVSADRIAARFGNLGRIDVEFDPFGGDGKKQRRCRRGPQLDIGFFRGRIEFKGEGGYTEVDASHTIGIVLEPKPKRCARRTRAAASAAPKRSLDTHLGAIWRRKGAVTSFELSRKRGNRWLSLLATLQERRGRMQIFRQSSTVVGGENAFAASGPGVTPPFAFVAAPKPFSGSAVFDASASPSSQWTGTLAAWMPGAGKVALTGPGYALSFCRRAADEPGCESEPPVQKPFLLTQGSGSQSQALGEARLSWSRYLRNSASSAGSTP
jgi:hypothetical protein